MQIVTGIVVGIHVVLSLVLVLLILLHAGRGGGLSDVFGGGMMSSNLGGSTLAERNLDRITVIIAVLFAVTTGTLTWLLAN
jgi:preprotein translocase subunit SecG